VEKRLENGRKGSKNSWRRERNVGQVGLSRLILGQKGRRRGNTGLEYKQRRKNEESKNKDKKNFSDKIKNTK
jgi:hypothetical protein